jgi:prevent-host-death family protein
MRVNVGQAKTDLSKLLARVEAGEDVEIARDGVPVARLVRVGPSTPGSRFLAAHGKLAGSITIGKDFEFSDAEIEALLDDPE